MTTNAQAQHVVTVAAWDSVNRFLAQEAKLLDRTASECMATPLFDP